MFKVVHNLVIAINSSSCIDMRVSKEKEKSLSLGLLLPSIQMCNHTFCGHETSSVLISPGIDHLLVKISAYWEDKYVLVTSMEY